MSFNKFLNANQVITPRTFSRTESLTTNLNKSFLAKKSTPLTQELYLAATNLNLTVPTLADKEDKILPTEQSVQQQTFLNPSRSHNFFKTSSKSQLVNNNITPHIIINNNTSLNALALSNRLFTEKSLPPVLSSSSLRNRFQTFFSLGTSYALTLDSTETNTVETLKTNPSSLPDTLSGSTDKAPTPLANLY